MSAASLPLVSVIIATYNRAMSLQDVLRDLSAQQTNGAFRFEVIVVDNHSSDSTRATIEMARGSYPVPLIYAFEGHQGKSYALNRGLDLSSGEFVAFTDDDVILGPGWLLAMYETFHRYESDGVGGPVRPSWIGQRPAWLGQKLERQLGLVDRGSALFHVRSARTIFIGNNSAYRRALFVRYGGFNAEHGGSEDSEWFLRILRAGHKVVYQPAANVLHKLESTRVTPKFFSRRFAQMGRGYALLLQQQGGKRSLCRVPLWMVRFYLDLHWRAFLAWRRGDHEEAMWHWLRRHLYFSTMAHCFLDWLMRRPLSPPPATIRPLRQQMQPT